MSASNTIALPTQGALKDLVRQAFVRVRAARALHAERARIRFELSQYSDRELSDMGLSRGDIEDVVTSHRPVGLRAV